MLSEEAQKRMTNKLKNQANKLRGAVSKIKMVKNVAEFDPVDTDNSQSIQEEGINIAAPAGYD